MSPVEWVMGEKVKGTMQAVILAAGLGTRMGSLTKTTPKPLLKIQDRTLLEHNLTALPDEIDEVILVVGYLADQIKAFIGNKFLGRKITYVHQEELLGTGHALSLCKDVLRDRFLALMGDDLYYEKDLGELIKKPLAVLVWEMRDDGPENAYAVAKIDQEGKLLNIVERQPASRGTLVNTGAYVLDKKFFNYPLQPAGNLTSEYGLPQTMLQMLKDGIRIEVVKAKWWHKVATADDLSSQLPSRT